MPRLELNISYIIQIKSTCMLKSFHQYCNRITYKKKKRKTTETTHITMEKLKQ